MSGIRYLIALLFLFAGLESELRANASPISPARSTLPATDIVTNLSSKTSFDKMTTTAPDRVPGILAERVIVPAPRTLLIRNTKSVTRASCASRVDAFCVSGCSPPV